MIIFVSDAFTDQYSGGAELTTEAIIQSSLFPINKVLASQVSTELMEKYKDSYWIFGNFSNLSTKAIVYAIKNLDYSIIEYDYKFCKFRSVKKHIHFEKICDCKEKTVGKLISSFFAKSKMNFWMSQKQLEIYQERFPFLNKNNIVLSSIFSKKTFSDLRKLKTNKKNNKWIILKSPSWIKGTEKAIAYAEKSNLEYELVWGLTHEDLLKKMASSRGLIFLPLAGDTCPRLVLEAKILGCELILNDDVQHQSEDWFKNQDPAAILTYLEGRAEFFWRQIEKAAFKNLDLHISESKENINFKFIVPFYNAEKWIAKCIRSLKAQRYKKFECYLIDDMSTDDSVSVAKAAIKDDRRIQLISNSTKQYALGNIVNTIEKINCKDEDVIILLDGDDWLASSYTLDTIANTYQRRSCLVTYGSYVYNPGGTKGIEPSKYSKKVIEQNSFREDVWRASHLRSFKHKLWQKINHEDLKDEDGHYYKMAYDQAIMLPLLEMSGERSDYIENILYVYNKENPLNVDKIKAQEQLSTAQKIRQKKPYLRI